MSEYDGTVVFKDWLPDQPDLNNPGLTEARNCVPIDQGYEDFRPLSTSLTQGSLPADVYGAFSTYNPLNAVAIFAGTRTRLYKNAGPSAAFSDRSASTYNTAVDGYWRWTQFESLVIATNGVDLPQYISITNSGNFATLGSTAGSAPIGRQIGRIGQFVVLGDNTTGAHVRWSGIDSPLSWPDPNTDTAIAQQSGEQFFAEGNGEVTGIASGDQFGLIFQRHAITRVSYVGGSVVFQFDDLNAGRGIWYPNATVQVGGLTYFIAQDGFYRTDGVKVEPIGQGKIDKWFRSNVAANYPHKVYGAADLLRNLIYWAFPETGSVTGVPTHILIHNIATGRFSHAAQTAGALVSGPPFVTAPYTDSLGTWIKGFSAANALGYFSGTPGTAILTTAEAELNPGGRAFVQGIKPSVVTSSLNALTAALGTRNDQSSSVNYTSEATANSRSGFCNFRSDARYHRARLTIAGTFNAAQGLEYEAVPSGYI